MQLLPLRGGCVLWLEGLQRRDGRTLPSAGGDVAEDNVDEMLMEAGGRWKVAALLQMGVGGRSVVGDNVLKTVLLQMGVGGRSVVGYNLLKTVVRQQMGAEGRSFLGDKSLCLSLWRGEGEW
jgi:hypothetical protein